jgi:hypothetical protein
MLFRLNIVDGMGNYQGYVSDAVPLSQITQFMALLVLPNGSYFQVVQVR